MSQNILTHNKKTILWFALFVLLVAVSAELTAILLLNDGFLVFTLDDPYIHLALAENILDGHYGINRSEFSAPSSSILWPFIISPFARLSISSYVLLIINTVSAIGTVYIYWRVLLSTCSIDTEEKYPSNKPYLFALVILIFATNLIGLIFTGMEHSLQVFFAALVILGLIHEIEKRIVTWWLVAAIILAPLIRYECLALSVPAILFIYFRGYRVKSISMASGLLVLVGGFSFFLMNLGLRPLPSSLVAKSGVAKSAVVTSTGPIKSILGNLKLNLLSSGGILLVEGMLFLAYLAFISNRKKEERLFAGAIAFAIVLHLLAGKFGWFCRYEIYIWAAAILSIIYLFKKEPFEATVKSQPYKWVGLILVSFVLLCAPYILAVTRTPLASNNIYEQHYQMHRFATEYYNKPVAVNDLGYVSYLNDNYVLDLWGLSSVDALHYRETNNDPQWISEITDKYGVKLAMIYEKWWYKEIPGSWLKVGELHLSKKNITPAESSVSFYALDSAAYHDIFKLAIKFKNTLPPGVKFEFCEQYEPSGSNTGN